MKHLLKGLQSLGQAVKQSSSLAANEADLIEVLVDTKSGLSKGDVFAPTVDSSGNNEDPIKYKFSVTSDDKLALSSFPHITQRL